MHKQMTVYLAGPMTGYSDYNYPAFYAAAIRWKEAGWNVINPAELDEELGDCDNIEEYMARDLPWVLRSDAIALLPGWEASRGARFEQMTAEYWGKRIYNNGDSAVKHPIIDHDFIEGENICCNLPDYRHASHWSLSE